MEDDGLEVGAWPVCRLERREGERGEWEEMHPSWEKAFQMLLVTFKLD